MTVYNPLTMRETTNAAPAIHWIDVSREQIDLAAEVRASLRETPKRVAAKFFYDSEGSRLFEEITRLPEYYLTRTELSILERHASEIVALFGPGYVLIEPGSGSSAKVRRLLDAGEAAAYMPIDLSADFLRESAEKIARAYPDVEVVAVSGDYTRLAQLPSIASNGRRVVFFPGSTLGNLEAEESRRFFGHIAGWLRPGDGMLLGVDQKKEARILDAAYNDASGVTAEFNLNLLRRLNRDLGADFDVSLFEHLAFYDESKSRIEMHLRALAPQEVTIDGETFAFRRGELLHTENSYKYDEDSIRRLLEGSGLRLTRTWTDEQRWFALHYLERSA